MAPNLDDEDELKKIAPDNGIPVHIRVINPDSKPGDPISVEISRNGNHFTITKHW
jgi:hypothetical protein